MPDPTETNNVANREPRKDPSSDPDWRSDPFWDPHWEPEEPRRVGFFNALGFLLVSLIASLSGAVGLILVTLLLLFWIGSTVALLVAALSPSGSLAGLETLLALNVVAWLLVWARFRRNRE